MKINWREVLSNPPIDPKYVELAGDWSTCAVGQINDIEKSAPMYSDSNAKRVIPADAEITNLGCIFCAKVIGAIDTFKEYKETTRESWRIEALETLDAIEKRADEIRIK